MNRLSRGETKKVGGPVPEQTEFPKEDNSAHEAAAKILSKKEKSRQILRTTRSMKMITVRKDVSRERTTMVK